MDELTIVVVVLGVILAIVTLVGHGIWVLLSLVFGGGRKSAASSRPRILADGRVECPRCRTPLEINQQVCKVCDWPHVATQPTDGAAALRTMRRQLEVFAKQGALDAESRAQLAAVIDAQERRLLIRQAATSQAPQVATPSAAPPVAAVAQASVPPELAGSMPAASVVAAVPGSVAPIPPSVPVAERARKYAHDRGMAMSEAMTEAAKESSVVVPPPKRREALSRLFAAFMEEKNIRWGELVGGLLIVGCSIALVISFWSEIASQPLLKFVLFNGVTAALFGVGMYTDRRWKIHTTSHGVLVIATLLVPLNFLAIAAFTQASPPTDLLSLAGEGVSLAVFALLVYFAGRILVPDEAGLLAATVMIPCLMQLLIRRFAGPGTSLASLYALAVVPVITYFVGTSVATRRRWFSSSHAPRAVAETEAPNAQERAVADGTRSVPATLDELEANRVLAFLGLASAAAVMPLALLLNNVPPMQSTLHWLSPLLAVCGLPALLVGLLFWRRMGASSGGWGRAAGEPPAPAAGGSLALDPSHPHSGLQTAGIAVGALGALIMAGAVVLAWPDPATLLPTAIVTGSVLTAVALWFGIPAAHVPAGVALAAATLVAFHLLSGSVSWTLADSGPIKSALLSAKSGHVLVPLVALFGGLAWWLRGLGRREDGFMYGLVAAATAAASLGLVVWFGFARVDDPANATWTLAIYALAALAAAFALNRTDIARVGSALLFATLVQGIVYRFNPVWQLEQPWIVALLMHASLITLGCAAFVKVAGTPRVPSALAAAERVELIRSLAFSAAVTSLAAALWIVAAVATISASTLAVYLAWLAGVWLMLAVLAALPGLFTASQVVVVLAILCGVKSAVETREWYAASPHPWLDTWFLAAQGIALAAYCLLLNGIRWSIARWTSRGAESVFNRPAPAWVAAGRKLLDPPWPTVDRVVTFAIVGIVTLVAIYAVLPGVAQEVSPTQVVGGRVVAPIEQFQIAGITHVHAASRGAWLLLVAVAATLAAGLWERRASWRQTGLLLVAMLICLLLAARWEPQVAVASALRWLSAGFFAAVSVAIWLAQRKGAARLAWLRATGSASAMEGQQDLASATFNHGLRDLLVAFVVAIYVAMAAYVCQTALVRSSVDASVQSMWPWVLMWALVAGLAGLMLPLAANAKQLRAPKLSTETAQTWAGHARWLFLLLAGAPAATLLAFAVAKALDQQPLVGPDPNSWFARIGNEASYGVPLVLIALTFIGYAIRDRVPAFAFAAGLLFNVVATIVVLLRLARGGGALDAVAWITVAQVNAIVSGIVAIVWLVATRWHVDESLRDSNLHVDESLRSKIRRGEDSDSRLGETRPRGQFIAIQVALAAALCAMFLIPAVVRLATEWSAATMVPSWVAAVGSPIGWCAIALAAAATMWLNWGRAASQFRIAAFAGALVSMITITTLRQGRSDAQAYHVLLAGCCAAAWILPLATRGINRLIAGSHTLELANSWSAWSVRAFDSAAVWLAIWEYSSAASWWVVGGLAAIGARNIVAAWREGRRHCVWIAASLVTLATNVWWLDIFKGPAGLRNGEDVFAFFSINALAVAAMSVISVAVERLRPIAATDMPRIWRGIAFHRVGAWAIVATLVLMTAAGLIADLMNDSLTVNWPLAWAAWLAAAITAAACLWDPAVRFPVALLYLVGLVAVGMYVDQLNLRSPMFHWALANALAAFALATSALWSVRDRLREVAARLGVPTWGSLSETAEIASRRDAATWAGGGHGWLVPANFLIGVGVLLLVVWIEQTMPSFTQRMVAAYAVGAQAFALGLLARGAVRTSLQYTALVWGVFFAVAFAWAWLPPDFAAVWLHRLVVTVTALAAVVVVYGFGLVKFLRRENEWTRAAARLVPSLAGLTAVLILLVLGIEVASWSAHRDFYMHPAAKVAVGLALALLVVAALVAALVPGRDPLGLSERGRTVYVYIAEALAALLFLHIRVTMDWLFQGWFLRFWPLVVMVIAFVGVGLGEVFQRRRQRILSEPLQTTGALLPLLPALGFWVMSSQVNYSLLLLSIGVLYAALSVLRSSFLYGMLAALAANGSLWYFLHKRDGLDLTEHPQLWLIPPALCALAAGYINRDRLSQQQSAALRYASAIVIYVSSTADVFIHGVAEAPWLPAVLAGLSILGVLAGILLRVQSFLYLGTAFLVVAIMTIIWHAADQHTWIWWVAGIVTGVLIIALFGLFEKRRDDVLRVVEQLKHWEA